MSPNKKRQAESPDPESLYTGFWNNKYLTSHVESIDDMIKEFQRALKKLKQMKADGIIFDFDLAPDDFIVFTTTKPELAHKYDMHKLLEEEDGDYDIDSDELVQL